MNRIATLTAIMLLALAGLLGGSCTQRSDEPLLPEPGVCYEMGFYLSVGELPEGAASTTTSRTPADGEYNPGDGLENYIELSTLRVGIYDKDDNFLHELNNLSIEWMAAINHGKRYKISGTVEADLGAGNFKVVVIANWPNAAALSSLDFNTLFTQEFDFFGGAVTARQLIPLYGVREVSKPLIQDVANDLGSIQLLRAVAKLEVCFQDDVDQDFWTYKQIPTLTAYTTKGYCAPTGVKSETYFNGSWSQDYLKTTFIPTSALANTGQNLPFHYCEDTGSYILYVPEYRNDVNYWLPATITLELNNTLTPGLQTIDINQPDIRRNVWYRFKIKKKPEVDDKGITVEVDVLPYHVIDLNPNHGLGGRPDMEEVPGES